MRIDPRNNGIVPTVKGEVRLGHVHSNGPEGDYVVIEIEDDVSGIRFLSLKIANKDTSKFFLHKATPCEVELQGLELIGCTREVKYEFVPRLKHARPYEHRDADAQDALAPFEVDGWKGSNSCYGNGHRSAKKGDVDGYSVLFSRYVRADGTPVL
jgi:hypothetical protein